MKCSLAEALQFLERRFLRPQSVAELGIYTILLSGDIVSSNIFSLATRYCAFLQLKNHSPTGHLLLNQLSFWTREGFLDQIKSNQVQLMELFVNPTFSKRSFKLKIHLLHR